MAKLLVVQSYIFPQNLFHISWMYCELYIDENGYEIIWILNITCKFHLENQLTMRLRLKIHCNSHIGIYRFSSSLILCVSNTVTGSSENGRKYLWRFFLPSFYKVTVLWPSGTQPFGTVVGWSNKMPHAPGRKDKFWSLNYLGLYRKIAKIVI